MALVQVCSLKPIVQRILVSLQPCNLVLLMHIPKQSSVSSPALTLLLIRHTPATRAQVGAPGYDAVKRAVSVFWYVCKHNVPLLAGGALAVLVESSGAVYPRHQGKSRADAGGNPVDT